MRFCVLASHHNRQRRRMGRAPIQVLENSLSGAICLEDQPLHPRVDPEGLENISCGYKVRNPASMQGMGVSAPWP
jgi:hypothetical protein